MDTPGSSARSAPGIVKLNKRRHWTLPLCIFSISCIECVFYGIVIIMFTLGLAVFKNFPNLIHEDEIIRDIMRYVIIGFASLYFLLAILLLIGMIKKIRVLLVIWMIAILILMVLEWICVVVSVAIFLNGSMFFISGSYGPLRLCFVCLTGLYAQRLKMKGQSATVVPFVKANADDSKADGYSLVHNAIFTQPLANDSEDTDDMNVKVTFELTSDEDQAII